MMRHNVAAHFDIDELERTIFRRLVRAMLIGSLTLVLWSLLHPRVTETKVEYSTLTLVNGVVFAFYIVAIAIPVLRILSKRTFRPIRRWLEAGATPDEQITRIVLLHPARQALVSMIPWVGGAIWAPILNMAYFYDPAKYPIFRFEVAVWLNAYAAFVVGCILVEHTMRGVFGHVLTQGTHVPTRTTSVGTRLVALWGAAGAVPLVGVIVLTVGLNEGQLYIARHAIWTVCLAGLTVGTAVAWMTARSFLGPLAELQRAMRDVESGSLDVAVVADDPGEIGLLKARFNRMVAGLRERKLLEDLFGRHVGTEVARQALTHEPVLGGERRLASFLFVDVIGSSRAAQELEPEEVVRLLNLFFKCVVESVASEGGWVNKFEGDGALCIFGVPGDQPDHSARALRAARRMRSALDELERTDPVLKAGIGVSSGEVVAGNIGTPDRYEYTVIGDAVNEAARITEAAKRSEARLLASEDAVTRAGTEAAEWTFAAADQLRGREGTTVLYLPASRMGVVEIS